MERRAKSIALRLREQGGAAGQALPAERSRVRRGAVRSYVLALSPRAGKAEAARYAIWWSTRFCLDYVRRLYWLPDKAWFGTTGFGELNHDAQRRARDVLAAGRAAAMATGERFQCPATVAVCADADLTPARRHGRFPLWVKVPCGPYIPAQPHRAFSAALRRGATLRPRCEIRQGKNGGLVARVFVEYPYRRSSWTHDVVAVDVGINSGVATSDGRLSPSLWPILKRSRERGAEQRRQGHIRSSARTAVKQILDREARQLVASAQRAGHTIAVERLKQLANLRSIGRAGGWARVHFGQRVKQIAEEVGCAVIEISGAYTSQTCPLCGHVDRENRRGPKFQCQRCGFRGNADITAARNLARRARRVVHVARRKGDGKPSSIEVSS